MKIVTGEYSKTLRIKWFSLLINLFCCYSLAFILSRVWTKATRFRRPFSSLGTTIIVMIAISFLVSICISKVYWGYFFHRPQVLEEVNSIVSITSVIPVRPISDGKGNRGIVAWEDRENSIQDSLNFGKSDSYYCLSERLLLALEKMNLLPSVYTMDISSLPPLFPLVEKTGILASAEKGYEDSDDLFGIVVDAVGESGQRLVFLGLHGQQISNDHHPYYELFFSGRQGSKELTYIRGQRFFYDVAGIEGMEWYAIWTLLTLISVPVGLVVIMIAIDFRRLLKKTGKIRSETDQPPLSKPGAPAC